MEATMKTENQVYRPFFIPSKYPLFADQYSETYNAWLCEKEYSPKWFELQGKIVEFHNVNPSWADRADREMTMEFECIRALVNLKGVM